MEKILNLTQHKATNEQLQAGVVEPSDLTKKVIVSKYLTFTEIPSRDELRKRAYGLAELVVKMKYKQVMIGGANYFMSHLELALKEKGIQPLYSFTQRVTEEQVTENGEIIKTSVFKHLGFVEV